MPTPQQVSNTANSAFTPTFAFDFPLAGGSTVTLLSASVASASNTLASPNVVVPTTAALNVASGATALTYTLPANSVAVFNLKVNW